MLDGLSLVSIRECSMDASDPIPSSCAPDIRFSEFRFVKADIGFFCRYADWKSRSIVQSKHVSFRTYSPLGVHQRILDVISLVSIRLDDQRML